MSWHTCQLCVRSIHVRRNDARIIAVAGNLAARRSCAGRNPAPYVRRSDGAASALVASCLKQLSRAAGSVPRRSSPRCPTAEHVLSPSSSTSFVEPPQRGIHNEVFVIRRTRHRGWPRQRMGLRTASDPIEIDGSRRDIVVLVRNFVSDRPSL